MEERKNAESIENIDAMVQNEEESSFDFRTLFTLFILNWQWFLLSIFIFLCGALIYLRYKAPTYQVSAKMLIKDDNRGRRSNGQMLANMQDLGFISNSSGIDNEVEILQSHILAREAVKDLKLYVEYKNEGRLSKQLVYKTQGINVDLDPASLIKMDDSLYVVKMEIEQLKDKYVVTGKILRKGSELPFETSFTSFPASKRTQIGTLTFTKNPNGNLAPGRSVHVTITPPSVVAARYIGNLTVAPSSKTTTIAQMTVKDQNPDRGMDFLKQLATCYNRQANADKNEIALKTEQFINGRLEKIDAELGTTEGALEEYKRRNSVTELRLDATQTVQQANEYSSKLAEANMQIQLLDYLREFVDNPDNKYQIIPSNVGLSDGASTQLINEFNRNVLDRNRLLRSASETAPQVMTLTSTLDDLQRSIRQALLQARRSADIQRQSINSQYSLYQSKVSNTPEQERILTQIGRQQEVKSGLYLMLLQKREENSISLAATADKGKLIDDPIFEGKVSPKSAIIMLAALILGFALPLLIVYLIQLMRYKIEGHEDVARLTNLPIIADVAVASESAKTAAGIVVHENQNDQIDEIFRSMRTNIQFMLKGNQKVILFTSSTSGEGKTFNAANLAVSFALLGKKVILCGLDIRKPALGRLFGISDRTEGITRLLVKEEVSKADTLAQIRPSGVNKNLDLLLAGPVPPNPAELLSRETLGEIIDLLKEEYDYVILDTAPVGLVTDTFQIGKYTDISVIVARADYTPKASIGMMNGINAEQKLPNMCIVLNGVDMSKKKYGYYYGYGKYGKYGRYGYGRYGYGRYGYGNYGNYGAYGSYGNYANSHYGNKNDNSIKK
ncbi:MAG: polysaccharide biosynthesis tyrosine autokinase [Prevotella sp.]|nr:polysaccharide biosynthesis tyrosine autokinase [Prevotella sp.]